VNDISILLPKTGLHRSLEIVEKALPKDAAVQSLENILLESDSRQLVLSSTNLELSIKVSLPFEGDEPGSVLLPPKLTDIVRLMPEQEVQLDLNQDNLHLSLSSGQSRYNLFGSDPADFPRVEELLPGSDSTITIDAPVLRDLLKMVVFAASTEETRPAFNGILFEFDGSRWNLISSDTYRLVFKSLLDGLALRAFTLSRASQGAARTLEDLGSRAGRSGGLSRQGSSCLQTSHSILCSAAVK